MFVIGHDRGGHKLAILDHHRLCPCQKCEAVRLIIFKS